MKKMKSLEQILIFLGLTIVISCSSGSIDLDIKGTRIVKVHLNINKFLVISNNSVDTIDLTCFPEHNFVTPYLHNSKEYIYLQETWKNEKNRSYNHQIIRVNLKGTIIDTVYIAERNEDITSYSISPDNKKILTRSNDYFAWRQTVNLPFDKHQQIDTSKLIIEYKLISLEEKEIVKQFRMKSNFYISKLTENSWKPDSKEILIYFRDLDKSKGGEKIVILNLETLDTAHINFGKNGIWSQNVPNEIFYIKENEIIKYNLENKQSTVILKLNNSEKFEDLRFTPDGRHLYFNYWKDRFCNKLFGDIVCYPYNAYGKVYDFKNNKSRRINGHQNLNTWKY